MTSSEVEQPIPQETSICNYEAESDREIANLVTEQLTLFRSDMMLGRFASRHADSDFTVSVRSDEVTRGLFPPSVEMLGIQKLKINYNPETVADFSEHLDVFSVDFRRLYVASGIANHIFASSLDVKRQDEFGDHMTQPENLFRDALGCELVDDEFAFETLKHILVEEDEVRTARINGLRLSMGAAYLVNGREFANKLKRGFLRELLTTFEKQKNHTAIMLRIFGKSEDESLRIFSSQISDVQLAGALPMRENQIEQLLSEFFISKDL
jgi:hypothetical protein